MPQKPYKCFFQFEETLGRKKEEAVSRTVRNPTAVLSGHDPLREPQQLRGGGPEVSREVFLEEVGLELGHEGRSELGVAKKWW